LTIRDNVIGHPLQALFGGGHKEKILL